MSLQSLNKAERQLIRRACHEAIENVDGLIDAYGDMKDSESIAKKLEWSTFILDAQSLIRRLG